MNPLDKSFQSQRSHPFAVLLANRTRRDKGASQDTLACIAIDDSNWNDAMRFSHLQLRGILPLSRRRIGNRYLSNEVLIAII